MTKKRKITKRMLRLILYVFAWTGMAIGYYFLFSIFFDTPSESTLRKNNRLLEKHYSTLNDEYEQLKSVLEDLKMRDENIYTELFESSIYDKDEHSSIDEEKLFENTNNELAAIFFDKLDKITDKAHTISSNFDSVTLKMQGMNYMLNYIPAIQPIANKELVKLTTSYGQRINPFYKTLMSHQAIDYAVPEDTRVFATADGVVKEVNSNYNSNGLTVILNHHNGYSTVYSHLNKATVKRGQIVRRGDIIAHTGNSGMSFMPHLHYEIVYKGMRIDPINYFFMELNHIQTNKLNNIAKIGMQSLD